MRLTVGIWLTYGSCTIVAIVFSTDRSPNSYHVCSSQIFSRSKYGPFRCFFRNVRDRVCATPAEVILKSACPGTINPAEETSAYEYTVWLSFFAGHVGWKFPGICERIGIDSSLISQELKNTAAASFLFKAVMTLPRIFLNSGA